MMMARIVTMVLTVPAIASPPVLKIAPMRGVRRVVPQVGQPAPRAMRPVMIPAFSRFSVFWPFCSRFLSQRRTIRPMRMLCNVAMRKIGSQSRKGWLMPKMAIKLLPII